MSAKGKQVSSLAMEPQLIDFTCQLCLANCGYLIIFCNIGCVYLSGKSTRDLRSQRVL